MYAITEGEFTTSGTADILVDRYIPLWGCPVSLPSDNGLQLYSNLSRALYQQNRRKLLPSLHQRRCRTRQTHDGLHARHGRRRTESVGPITPSRRERV